MWCLGANSLFNIQRSVCLVLFADPNSTLPDVLLAMSQECMSIAGPSLIDYSFSSNGISSHFWDTDGKCQRDGA